MAFEGVSKEDLKEVVREAVEEVLLDLFGDPDEGFELRPEVRERLRCSLERIRRGETGISVEEAAKRAGFVQAPRGFYIHLLGHRLMSLT